MSRFDVRQLARHLTHHPRWVMCTIQLAIFAAAGFLAFLLRFDFTVPGQFRPQLLAALCVFVPAKILTPSSCRGGFFVRTGRLQKHLCQQRFPTRCPNRP